MNKLKCVFISSKLKYVDIVGVYYSCNNYKNNYAQQYHTNDITI